MLPYLLECRRRMLQILVCFLVLFMVFYWGAPNLFHTLIHPLLKVLPANDSLIATQITTPVFMPIRLAADAALLVTTPFALLHIWRFVSPGLYRRERESLRWVLVCSMVFFALGLLFCFYLVLPYMFLFFAQAVPLGVRLMPDMGHAVDFITRMLLIFGLCFQVPLVCLVLVRLQLVSLATLKMVRPYVIVISFIVGMLLTPPDVFSQIMLAVPLCLLYEAGIVFSRFGSRDSGSDDG
jgi:sec-independent protein translocase protein TatC